LVQENYQEEQACDKRHDDDDNNNNVLQVNNYIRKLKRVGDYPTHYCGM
jgi:hypothetical protein